MLLTHERSNYRRLRAKSSFFFFVGASMNWLRWIVPSRSGMSAGWLAQINRPSSRVEFHGVCLKWPIKKILDESPIWNTNKLRKSA